MADDTGAAESSFGPDSLSTRGLPTARRGYEKKAVDALVAEAADAWADLASRYAEMIVEVEKVGGIDHLARDLGEIGKEVERILSAADDAAKALRNRAKEDAERVTVQSLAESETRLAEATAEAERLVTEAEEQAFELRRSAWEQATNLVEGSASASERALAAAQEDVLRLRADAERESHRRVAATRKDSEDIIRGARHEADLIVNRAMQIAAEIAERTIEGDPAMGGDRAAVLAAIEAITTSRSIADVAILPAEPAPDAAGGTGISESLAADIEQLGNGEPSRSSAPPGPVEIETLFDALRETSDDDAHLDAVAQRDRRLLSIRNAAAGEVKRRIADVQDEAVVSGDSAPSVVAVVSELAGALNSFIVRAATAGAEAAKGMAGVAPVAEPGRRPSAMVEEMATDLTAQLAVVTADDAEPADVRRVLRMWRVDEAERWVQAILGSAYHDAMLASLAAGGVAAVRGVPSGVPCVSCLGADSAVWDPARPPKGMLVPPASPDCRCAIEVERS